MNDPAKDGSFRLDLNEQTLPIIAHIADQMPGGFFIYRATGEEELLYVNKAVLRIYGCETLEEFKALTGYTFPGLVHPEDLDATEETIARQIAESKEDLDYVEYRIIRKDGSVRYIMDYGHFLKTKDMGEVFFVFIDDATDKYLKIQEEVRKTEVIEGLSQNYRAIFLLDFEVDRLFPYGAPTDWGREALAAVNGSYAGYIRQYAKDFVHPDDLELFRQETGPERIRQRLKQECSFTISYRRKTSEDVLDWEELSFTRIEDENRYTRAVMGFRIITRRVKKIQAETRDRVQMEYELDEARHANQAKSTFLFNMSHDIRTPMNAIVGFTALARKHMGDPEQLSDCLDKLELSSNHLTALIDDVLDMSQIESGQLRLKPKPCDLSEQLSIVLEMLSAEIMEKQLDFRVHDHIKRDHVLADPLNLRRILSNIIGNAVKFTPRGGQVRVRAEESAGPAEGYVTCQFMVSDTGVGMSKEFMDRMFDAFERENTATKTGQEGTGLGLSITKSLVDMMDGSIEVESEKDRGSTFTVTLDFPLSGNSDRQGASRLERLLDSWRVHKLRGKRILMAEDNELNREITTELLGDMGLVVESVPNGKEAVRAVETHEPGYYDLVLMDIQMPVMDGLAAASAIRALGRKDAETLPIVALSANSMDSDKRRSLESGMNGHIAKPIDMSTLVSALTDNIL